MGFIEKVKKISKVVIDKGVEVGKAAKTQIDIATMESQINDCKKKIGDIICKEKIKIKNIEIEKEIKRINILKEKIEEKRKNN